MAGKAALDVRATLVRTPTPPSSPNLSGLDRLDAANTMDPTRPTTARAMAEAGTVYNMGFGANLRMESRPDGTYTLMQQLPLPQRKERAGSTSEPGRGVWFAIKWGISANASVVYGNTYEWELGLGGNISGIVQKDRGANVSGTAGAYTKIKIFGTLMVNEPPRRGADGNPKAADQFRVRLYRPSTGAVQLGLGGSDSTGVTGATPVNWDLIRLEYRWGKMTLTPAQAANAGNNQPALPPKKRMYEYGFSFSLSAGLDPVAFVAAKGDPDKLKALAATLPAGSVTLHIWALGINEVLAYAKQKKYDWENPGPDNDGNRTTPTRKKLLLGKVVEKLGVAFQHWVLAAAVPVSLTGAPNVPATTAETDATARTLSSTSTSTPASSGTPNMLTDQQIDAGIKAVTNDFDALMTYMEDSGLATIAKTAAPIISAAVAANTIRKFASKKGLLSFTRDTLSPGQQERLDDKIFERAFDLALTDSGPDKDGKVDQKKGFLKLPNESVAGYGARVTQLVMSKMAQAAKDVLLDEDSWSDFLSGPSTSSAAASSAAPGAAAGAGAGAAAGAGAGAAAAAAAVAAAGLGLGGALIGGIGSGSSNNIVTADDDKDPDSAAGNAGTKALHAADARQGDTISDAREAKIGPTLTNVEANDPRFMASFVARLKTTGDVEDSRSYAQRVSRLGLTEAAAVRFAAILTPAEAKDDRFMAALAGRLGFTEQNMPASLGFARNVTALDISRDNAIYFSATVTPQEAGNTRFMAALAKAAQSLPPAEALAATRQMMAQPNSPGRPGKTPEPAVNENLAFGQRIVREGSKDDAQVNNSEFRSGLEKAGFDLSYLGTRQTDMLIAAYDADGNGALSAKEIGAARTTGGLAVQGSAVAVNPHATITTPADAQAFPTAGTPPGQGNPDFAANTAKRVVSAGSSDDDYANRSELRAGFKAAGYADVQGSDADIDAVIANYGSGNGALNTAQLAQAIANGGFVLQANGSVRTDAEALALPSFGRGIINPLIGSNGNPRPVVNAEPGPPVASSSNPRPVISAEPSRVVADLPGGID